MKENVLIYGAGTIGTYVGTKLSNASFNVVLYGKDRLNTLKNVININDSEQLNLPPKVVDITNQNYNIVFVTTKLYDLKQALSEIKEKGLIYNSIVFIQNGIIPDVFFSGLEKEKIVQISISDGCTFVGDDKIITQPNIKGWSINISKNAGSIKSILNESGIISEIKGDFLEIQIEKMIVNCAISIVSVLEDKTIGGLINNKNSLATVNDLIDEVYNVLSHKFKIGKFELVKERVVNILKDNSSHYPSLHQDFKQNRKTEAEYFNWQIIGWAKEQGIDVPVNEKIYSEFNNKLTN